MTIEWREKMSVGNDLIDTEHKYLLSLVNTLEQALHTEAEARTAGEVLERLLEYTQTHFDHEEKLQRKIKYPLYKEHKAEHDKIIEDVLTAREHLRSQPDDRTGENAENAQSSTENDDPVDAPPGENGVDDDELRKLIDGDIEEVEIVETTTMAGGALTRDAYSELVGLIRKWVIEHILLSDLKMKRYLANLPPGAQ